MKKSALLVRIEQLERQVRELQSRPVPQPIWVQPVPLPPYWNPPYVVTCNSTDSKQVTAMGTFPISTPMYCWEN